MHVRSRWAELHIYIIILSFLILWCKSVMITLESAKDQELSVSTDIAVAASSILKNTHQEKLDRVGLLGWAIIGLAIFTVCLFGLQNCLRNRKRYRRYAADLPGHTYRQT